MDIPVAYPAALPGRENRVDPRDVSPAMRHQPTPDADALTASEPAGGERADRTEPGTGAARQRVLARMLELWRTAAHCEPASDDASATLVPAAAPSRAADDGAGDAEDADDAGASRTWSALPRAGVTR
jgi:hypothetical protein